MLQNIPQAIAFSALSVIASLVLLSGLLLTHKLWPDLEIGEKLIAVAANLMPLLMACCTGHIALSLLNGST